MWAPRGRKKQLPGLSAWKKNSSCSCEVGHVTAEAISSRFPRIVLRRTHLPDATMVTKCSCILSLLPGLQLLRAGEGDGSDALQ